MRDVRFRSMGTEIQLLGPENPALERAARRVRDRFAREELRFSRFRPDSELSRVNRAAGTSIRVTAGFAEVLAIALAAAEETGGLFDPSVHDALVAAGYDRDFDEVLAGARGRLHPAEPCGRWREIDLEGDRLRLPSGVHIDLGGVAKGWTADRAALEAVSAGLPWALVNAGGDMTLIGDSPGVDVAIEDPEQPGVELVRTRLAEGALATSSVMKRSWAPGAHHVIDPRTGSPARTGTLQATVWGPTCARAEVLATHALLRGRTSAPDVPAILVTDDREVIVSMPVEDAA